MMPLAARLGLYFALKVGIVAACASKIAPRAGSWAMGAALSWVGLQIGLTGFLLLLSPFGAVGGTAVWMFLGAVFVLLVAAPSGPVLWRGRLSPLQMLAGLGALALFAALFYRSLYFFDNTWDAMTYELPRLSFYIEARSLLVAYPTQMINIFANEWNDELAGLAAALACGTDQAMGFGGAEIWIWGWVALIAVAQRLGARTSFAWGVSLLLMSTPAVLGLAMAVKGDLMAILALSLGFSCLLSGEGGDEVFLNSWAIVVLAFAVGAKIIVAPAALLLAGWAGLGLWHSRRFWPNLLPIALISSVAACRYLLNFAVYHNAVKRVGTEQAFWGVATLWSNIKGIAEKSFGGDLIHWEAPGRWVFGFGLGAAAWLTLGLLLAGVCCGRPVWSSPKVCRWGMPLILLTTGWLAALCGIPWMPWSFRYHLPWVLVLTLFALVVGGRRLSARGAVIMTLIFFAAVPLQAIYAWGQGEEIPVSFLEARGSTQLARKLALHPYISSDGLQKLSDGPRLNITIFNQIDSCLLPFFGDDSRHHVRLVDSPEALVLAAQDKPDRLVITGPASNITPGVLAAIERSGYTLDFKNVFFMVFSFPTAAGRMNRTP